MARSQRNKTIFDRPQKASGKINFCNSAGQMKYRLLEDVAFLKDSSEYEPVNDSHLSYMQRIIYSIEDENYILSGVPYKWLASYTDGTIILDPTVTIQPSTDDVWIEYNRSTNYGGYTSIRIGRQSSYGWKRSLVKFDLSSIPAGANIISSTMSLRWYGCYGTYKIDRLIKCHQMKKNWDESQATWYKATSAVYWEESGVAFDGDDANPTAEDSLIWGTSGYPCWKNYNLSSLTQKWIDGEENNYGVILWATNESQYSNMDEKRCNSSESTTASYRPKLIVTYTTTKNIATYSYDEKGRVRSVSYGNGMTEENTYDANRGWLLSKTYSKSGIIKFRAYNRTYDDVGNLTYSKENEHLSYYYDDYYRLESVDYEERTKYYSYDENGNLTSIRGSSIPVNSSDNKMNVAGYAYDANGNMTTHNGNTVTYDWRNMMTGYGANTYTYDAFGERVRKYENSQYHYYITSGMNILEEYNHDQSLAVMHIYNGIERIASIIPGDDMYYACSDNVMSARALVDESGNKDQTRDFYPYGEIYYAYGDKTKYQFSGKELDATGLYYFGARYYDPGIGRWLTCDPAGQFHSPYSYCGGNPVIYVDPDGEWFLIDDAIAAGVGFVVGYVGYGLTTGEWDGRALVYGAIGADAAWITWNTGGAALAAGAKAEVGLSGSMTLGQTVGLGVQSGTAGGVFTGATTYIEQAAWGNSGYSMSNLRSNWNFGGFAQSTVMGGISGGIGGGISTGASWGMSYWGNAASWNKWSRTQSNSSVNIPKLSDVPTPPKTEYVDAEFDGKQFQINEFMSDGSVNRSSYNAQSGPWGPKINDGVWTATGVTNDPNKLTSGMIRDNVGWKVYLRNQFGRTGMRIHPDGGRYIGTLGCIGIQENSRNLILLYNQFSNYFSSYNTMNIYVIY